MRAYAFLFLATCLFASAPASAQYSRDNAGLLGQALDRCMTTYAVRESRAETNDEVIYERAKAGCEELEARLYSVIRRDFTAEQSAELIAMLDDQSKPLFLANLQQIRAGRLQRPIDRQQQIAND